MLVDISINHGGDLSKAKQMVDDAVAAGAEGVSFQCHISQDELSQNILGQCTLSEQQDQELIQHIQEKGLKSICIPSTVEAAQRLVLYAGSDVFHKTMYEFIR